MNRAGVSLAAELHALDDLGVQPGELLLVHGAGSTVSEAAVRFALEVRPTALLVGTLLPMTLVLEPVRETLHFGQINALLMVLVVADCLVRAARWWASPRRQS